MSNSAPEWDEKQYRLNLLQALQAVKKYNGSELAYEELMIALIAVEQQIRNTLNADGGQTLKDAEQKLLKNIFPNRPCRSIDALIDRAIRRFTWVLKRRVTREEPVAHLGITHVKVNKVLAPPKSQAPVWGDGTGEWKRPQFEQRLQCLIAALQKHNIFTSDLILYTGLLAKHQMRQISYSLVEIPKIRKEVFLCDQIGEATFVSQRNLGVDAYTIHQKQLLEAIPGVTRLICRNREEWEENVIRLLFADQPVKRAMNVKDVTEIRSAIKAHVNAKQWVEMKSREKEVFKVSGKGLYAIATVFGIEGNLVKTRYVYLELGAKIFGEEDPVIKQALEQMRWEDDPEQWREAVKKVCTAEQWVGMQRREKLAFRVGRKGLCAIATIFGIEEDAVNIHDVNLELGARIFGEEDPVIAKKLIRSRRMKKLEEECGDDPEKWRNAVKKVCTVEQWVEMKKREKLAFRVGRKKLIAIARVFGIDGNPVTNHDVYLELGVKIFGEEDPAITASRAKYRKRDYGGGDF